MQAARNLARTPATFKVVDRKPGRSLVAMGEQAGVDDGGMQWFEEVGRREKMEETQTERKSHHGWI
jgi:hypothetical protein